MFILKPEDVLSCIYIYINIYLYVYIYILDWLYMICRVCVCVCMYIYILHYITIYNMFGSLMVPRSRMDNIHAACAACVSSECICICWYLLCMANLLKLTPTIWRGQRPCSIARLQHETWKRDWHYHCQQCIGCLEDADAIHQYWMLDAARRSSEKSVGPVWTEGKHSEKYERVTSKWSHWGWWGHAAKRCEKTSLNGCHTLFCGLWMLQAADEWRA